MIKHVTQQNLCISLTSNKLNYKTVPSVLLVTLVKFIKITVKQQSYKSRNFSDWKWEIPPCSLSAIRALN